MNRKWLINSEGNCWQIYSDVSQSDQEGKGGTGNRGETSSICPGIARLLGYIVYFWGKLRDYDLGKQEEKKKVCKPLGCLTGIGSENYFVRNAMLAGREDNKRKQRENARACSDGKRGGS